MGFGVDRWGWQEAEHLGWSGKTLAGGTLRNGNGKIGGSWGGDGERILNMVPGRGIHSLIHSETIL